jgi:hypothetical protein
MGISVVITPGQMRCIYALARKGGLDDDALHAVVENVASKKSIKTLTALDAKKVIDKLKCLTGQETTGPHDRPTKEQVAKIHALVAKLGWSDDPHRLTAWLEKRYNVSHPRFLREKSARNCIEAMKAMLLGGRGERKGVCNGKVDGRTDD